MSENLTFKDAANVLSDSSKDNFVIITHQSPDGDTLGSACALYFALKQMGKKVQVVCHDNIPTKYSKCFDIKHIVTDTHWHGKYILTVDVADTKLIGDVGDDVKSNISLAIDHHPSNTCFASQLCLEGTAAATCQIMYKIIRQMPVNIDKVIANCLYTGITTDTGCFKYSSVNSETHLIAADLIRLGADNYLINKLMFDTKSKAKLALEARVLSTMEYSFNDRCLISYISNKVLEETGATEFDTEGIAAIPMQIEGVELGITIKDKGPGMLKGSIRTSENYDASEIAFNFDGGGHARAAGFAFTGTIEELKAKLKDIIAGLIC